jgi:hypothetical protein
MAGVAVVHALVTFDGLRVIACGERDGDTTNRARQVTCHECGEVLAARKRREV